jgi:hypothetical protein
VLIYYQEFLDEIQNDIQRGLDDEEGCCYLLEDINPCFFRTVRELTFDVVRGKIIIDEAFHGIFKYKEVLLKICRPQIPHSVALSRLFRWDKIFPKLLPLWWECMYEVKAVLFEQEDKKKKWDRYLRGDGAPISAKGYYYRRKKAKKADKESAAVAPKEAGKGRVAT